MKSTLFPWEPSCYVSCIVKEQRLREPKGETEKTLLSLCYSQIHTGNSKKSRGTVEAVHLLNEDLQQ